MMVNLGIIGKLNNRDSYNNKNVIADKGFPGARRRQSFEGLNLFGQALIIALEKGRKAGFEDGNITKAYFSRLHSVEIGCLTVSIIGAGLSVIEYDLEFALNEEYQTWTLVLLYLIFASSLLLSILTVVRYIFDLQYLKKRGEIANHETLYSTGMCWNMIIEICLIMIIPYPWLVGKIVPADTLRGDFQIIYPVNSIIQIFSVLRLIVVIRLVIQTTKWNDTRSQRLCNLYGVKPGLLFTLKCVMKTNPLVLILSTYVTSILLFGYVLRIAEKPTDRIPGNTTFFTYPNSMWCVFTTMATVGYGDYYPMTFLGRMIVFFISLWGTSIVSLMVVSLSNLLSQSRLEEKAFTIINRVLMREKLKNLAAGIITNLVRGNLAIKRNREISQACLTKIKRYLKQFKWTGMLYRELANDENGFEVMDRQFTMLRDQVKGLRRKLDYMSESNKNVMALIGVDPKLAEQLNKHLKSTITQNKESTDPPKEETRPGEPNERASVEPKRIVNPSVLSNISEGLRGAIPSRYPYSFAANTNVISERVGE